MGAFIWVVGNNRPPYVCMWLLTITGTIKEKKRWRRQAIFHRFKYKKMKNQEQKMKKLFFVLLSEARDIKNKKKTAHQKDLRRTFVSLWSYGRSKSKKRTPILIQQGKTHFEFAVRLPMSLLQRACSYLLVRLPCSLG